MIRLRKSSFYVVVIKMKNIRREFSSIDDLLLFMKKNNVFKFEILADEEFNQYNSVSAMILLSDGEKNTIVMTSRAFDDYYLELASYYKDLLKEQIKSGVKKLYIPDFVLDNDLIEFLRGNLSILSGVEIEFVNFENFKHLIIYGDDLVDLGLKISNLDVCLGNDSFHTCDISEHSDEYILDLFESGDLGDTFYLYSIWDNNEKNYIERLLKIFRQLESSGKKYNIRIEVSNRELLIRSGLLNFSNINLTIISEEGVHSKEIYSSKEFLEEDAILEELVKPIREANLSPFEMYLAAYDIVKTYKAYEKNKDDSKLSNHLKYVLDKSNKYIACVGYSNLLTALLNKLGICSYTVSLDVDISKKPDFKEGNDPLEGHMRNIVMLDDDKYNIHGIYECDTTWDNHRHADYYYDYVAMTFDRVKELECLESLIDEDLLLDFHNLNDFHERISRFLANNVRSSRCIHYNECQKNGVNVHFNEEEAYVKALKYLYTRILEIFMRLDYDRYLSWFKKYNSGILDIIDKYINGICSLDEVLAIFEEFLREYYNYIILISNKAISDDNLYAAILEVKRKVDGLSDEDAMEYVEAIKIIRSRDESSHFPYVFNPKNSGSIYFENLDNPDESVRPNYLEKRGYGRK